MKLYYTVVYDGNETDRGIITRYKSLRSFMRYFMDGYANRVYDNAVANDLYDIDIEIRVYAIDGMRDTLVKTVKI
jgi:hypothetical protein